MEVDRLIEQLAATARPSVVHMLHLGQASATVCGRYGAHDSTVGPGVGEQVTCAGCLKAMATETRRALTPHDTPMAATGADLDTLALNLGVTRYAGEGDSALRLRVATAMKRR